MRPGFGQFNVPTDEYLQYAAQFSATDILLNMPLLPGGGLGPVHGLDAAVVAASDTVAGRRG